MKHLSFFLHFGKRTEDNWWLGVGLDSCDQGGLEVLMSVC